MQREKATVSNAACQDVWVKPVMVCAHDMFAKPVMPSSCEYIGNECSISYSQHHAHTILDL